MERESINPFNLPVGLFKGPEKYLELKEGLMIGTIIRAYNYGMTAPNEPHYVVGPSVNEEELGEERVLYDIGKFSELMKMRVSSGLLKRIKECVVDPKKVLQNEDGWSFEGLGIIFFPQDMITEMCGKGILSLP
jgi:hypothetical protein